MVLNFGAVQKEVLTEGLHFRIPIMQKILKIDVRIQKSQSDAASVSKDLQDTKSIIAVNYHVAKVKNSGQSDAFDCRAQISTAKQICGLSLEREVALGTITAGDTRVIEIPLTADEEIPIFMEIRAG